MKEFLDKIKENSSSKIIISDKFYSADISKAEFEELRISKDINSDKINNDKNNSQRTIWIDGGNAEILTSPAYSFQLIKATTSIWQGIKKEKDITEKSLVFIDGKLNITTDSEFTKKILETYSINSQDKKELLLNKAFGEKITTPKQIGELFRRIMELTLAKKMEIDYPNSTIIIDGSLITPTKIEKEIVNSIQNATLLGISKSSNLATENRSLLSEIEKIANTKGLENTCFIAKNIIKSKTDIHNAEIIFSKLHKKSKILLKSEIAKNKLQEVNLPNTKKIFENLITYCKDPIFLGYPYPLIKVDDLARVTNEEISYYKTKILIYAKKSGLEIEKEELTKNSHDILDSIKF